MIENHGVEQTIIFHKEILRFIQQSCMNQGTTLNQNVLPFWTRTKSGFPQFLIKGLNKPILDLMDDIRFRQGLLTICNFYKTIKGPVNTCVSTIIEPNPMSHTSIYRFLIEDIGQFFEKFISQRKIQHFQIKSDNPVYLTPKAGANGPNAIGLTSILDAMAIQEKGIDKLIFSMANSVFTEKAIKKFNLLFSDSISRSETISTNIKKLITGRLHFLQEGGGKTRVICIPDIWSQCVLQPIHDYLYKDVLRKLPCDGTFSHSGIASRVRKYTRTGKLTCYDLKAATDRMPVDLQERILSIFLGKELASQWRDLLCNRDYYVKGDSVRYAVGQPMGFLTSWAAMAITHHAIINYAKRDKSFYGIIGDDIVIASKRGAENYKDILKILNMEISLEKSIFGNQKNNLGEIAKRLFINGSEISPIPPDILINCTGNLVGFQEFIRVFSEKFHHVDQGGFSDSEYQHILNDLFLISRFKDDEDALVLLSCPILENFRMLPNIPPLTRVRKMWRTDIHKKRILMDFERFFLESCNNRTNSKVVQIMDPKSFVESTPKTGYPIYEEAKLINQKNLTLIINRINTTYIGDEADGFAEGPIKDIRDILSCPDPTNDGMSKTYLSKREIRLRNTNSVIQQFYKSRLGRLYQVQPSKK